ncbi:hypothetical protein DFA_11307 [Cavenderia fasciculata]|uniref:Uncharacterized protein n=1 Tax=Cavenderia fasciculata TaxID=261658 RepID=F4QC59_CACFS|nr:uncharacterized protein DFA_11307 [Cavenderia fasciculata]EGG13546.1 hypothetical protein DFA_11307 [Cavenderia fasciculata]|eukprot:XP_004350250.1 hypothetical protein DFA_11307 [Cavenderia fasciculata]
MTSELNRWRDVTAEWKTMNRNSLYELISTPLVDNELQRLSIFLTNLYNIIKEKNGIEEILEEYMNVFVLITNLINIPIFSTSSRHEYISSSADTIYKMIIIFLNKSNINPNHNHNDDKPSLLKLKQRINGWSIKQLEQAWCREKIVRESNEISYLHQLMEKMRIGSQDLHDKQIELYNTELINTLTRLRNSHYIYCDINVNYLSSAINVLSKSSIEPELCQSILDSNLERYNEQSGTIIGLNTKFIKDTLSNLKQQDQSSSLSSSSTSLSSSLQSNIISIWTKYPQIYCKYILEILVKYFDQFQDDPYSFEKKNSLDNIKVTNDVGLSTIAQCCLLNPHIHHFTMDFLKQLWISSPCYLVSDFTGQLNQLIVKKYQLIITKNDISLYQYYPKHLKQLIFIYQQMSNQLIDYEEFDKSFVSYFQRIHECQSYILSQYSNATNPPISQILFDIWFISNQFIRFFNQSMSYLTKYQNIINQDQLKLNTLIDYIIWNRYPYNINDNDNNNNNNNSTESIPYHLGDKKQEQDIINFQRQLNQFKSFLFKYSEKQGKLESEDELIMEEDKELYYIFKSF